ncbi:endonuclease III domain-containing protein [Lentisalinibacter salinarum]|uniref:endonuclease III domain-containing protein n=1 Tax=Lentisalinibacter salinarum TaxID=2992239 RepID=UPI00386355CB
MLNHAEAPRTAEIRRVGIRLREEYRDYAHDNKTDPLDELIFILLSIRTQAHVNEKVYRAFKKAFPNYHSVDRHSRHKLISLLRPAGLADQRAGYLLQILTRIRSDFGSCSLRNLQTLDDDSVEAYLLTLPGIGLKIARCIMLYSLNRAVFPVDTNCWRIACRLEWFPCEGNASECSRMVVNAYQGLIPNAWRYSLHVNLVSHGRLVCRNTRPRCGECVLLDLCPSAGTI